MRLGPAISNRVLLLVAGGALLLATALGLAPYLLPATFTVQAHGAGALVLPTLVAVGAGCALIAVLLTLQLASLQSRRDAQERLRRYEQIVNASSDLVAFVNRSYRYEAVNAVYLEAVGLPREAVIGQRVSDVLGAMLFETRVKPMLDRCFAGERGNSRFWVQLPASGRRFVDAHYDPYVDDDGTISGALVDIRDITENKRAEESLRESERRYRVLYDDTPAMFFTVDSQGTITSVNHFGATQLGYLVDELVYLPLWMLYRPEHKGLLKKSIEACYREPEQVHRWEACKLRKDGTSIWVRETGRVVREIGGQAVVLVVSEDTTEAHSLSERLAYQATHDGLTGLVNRREFERRLQGAVERAHAHGEEHALCYLDLDQFKVVNDTCGHMAGDELLRQLGRLMARQVRKHDTLARLGGDEFGVLLEDCSLEHSQRVATKLKEAVCGFRFLWEDKSFNIGVSIGLVPITSASAGVDALLSAADAACYAAKDQGRNRIQSFTKDDTEVIRQYGEMQWVVHLERALEEDGFVLHYQPIRRLSSGDPEGAHYEVLLRMMEEGGELVSPGSFLPAAERYGLSVRIDRWVVDRMLTWLAQNPEHLSNLHLCCINLSGRSVADQGFMQFLAERIDGSPVPADKLCFEVTETAAVGSLASARRFMETLSRIGCRFALDDFGSGLSSFAYLKHLPVDFLKIDGMFVRDIAVDPINCALVKSIHDVGRVMCKRIVAEFIEDEPTLEEVRRLGVDYGQGYRIGAPRPLEELEDTRRVPACILTR